MNQQELIAFWKEQIEPRFTYSSGPDGVHAAGKFKGGFAHHVYLDNAATTKPFKRVLERVVEDFPLYGSVHRGTGRFSNVTTYRFEKARETVREAVGASEENYVLIIKNTTEAINLAAALWKEKPGKVLVSDVEHSSNLLPWLRTQETVRYQTTQEGCIDPDTLELILKREKVKLLAVTGASNVTGYKPEIHVLAKLCHQYGAQILVDACQLIPHEEIDMLDDDDPQHLDFIAFSGHKMYAPFGAGCLVGPKRFFDSVMPYQIGGGSLPYITTESEVLRLETVQTHDPGTPNVMGLVAMEEAFRQMQELGSTRGEYEQGLIQGVFEKLQQNEKVKLYIPKLYGTVIPFDIVGMPARLVAEILSAEYSIGTRAGSFCTYELVRRMKGFSPIEDRDIAHEVRNGILSSIPGIVRASFSIYNRVEEVHAFISAIEEITMQGAGAYTSRYFLDSATGAWHPTVDSEK